MELSVSILGIKDDIEKIKKIENSKTNYIHLDIMDGKFVDNKVDMLKKYNKPLDVHLMVEDVESYVDIYKTLEPVYITFHIETLKNPTDMINYLHSQNIKVGLSICPDTDVDILIPYLDKIDLVLVMSVNPGRGGQQFMDNSLLKIEKLYNLREQNHYHYKIEVDGGVNVNNKHLLNKCDIVVVGSYITKSIDYDTAIDAFIC